MKSRIRWEEILHEWRRKGKRIGYCRESQKERDHHEDKDINSLITLIWILLK
jgi:hypothetical protein